MRIDAHQHYWQVARGDYGWLTADLGSIYRDFAPGDLAPHLARNTITRTILVQAAPTMAETAYLLDLAHEHASVAGVVGWADFEAVDAEKHIGALAVERKLVGLRPMLHDLPRDDWMLDAKIAPALRAMIDNGLVFDALVRPRHLANLEAFARQYPALSIVIDHAAKPDIARGQIEPWRTLMTQMAACPNVTVKLSGMVTEAAHDWRPGDFAPYIAHLLQSFGPQRMIWGSDWPVLELAADYDRWCWTTEQLLAHVPATDAAAIFGGNAQRIYLTTRGST